MSFYVIEDIFDFNLQQKWTISPKLQFKGLLILLTLKY